MAVFIGRLIPGVRSFISVPAGIANMNLPVFLLYSTLGTIIWTGLLTVAGFLLESQYENVEHWLNPVSWVVMGLIVAWYIYGVITFDSRRESSRAGE